jgi:ADP-ribose diphosphatase
MPAKPKVLSQETVARSQLFHVQALELQFSNGEHRRFERLLSHRQAVLIVPLLDDKTVLLIREYAAGVDRYELALPKGLVEAEETFEAAANRELMEEVGYGAHQLHRLTELSLSPGYMSHTTQVVLAENLYEKRLLGDEPEPIEVVSWPLADLSALFARNDCTEARSIAALLLTRDWLAQRA